MTQRIAALLLLQLGMLIAAPAACVAGVPQARVALLARGLNISHWFAQSHSGYGADHLKHFLSREDMTRIAAAGFRHVRIGIEPAVAARPEALDKLMAAVASLDAAGLAVVVDLHANDEDKRSLRSETGRSAIAGVWRALAGRLARTDPERVFLEVMNEPFPLAGAEWWRHQDALIGVIRAAAPRHTIVANAGGWSGIDDLVAMQPVSDANVVYTFHWYAPLLFTHQGATWTWPVARRVGPVEWPMPAASSEVAGAARSARDDEASVALRHSIALGEFAADFTARQVAKVEAWRRRHGDVPVYAGEFGVYAAVAPRPAALAWIEEVRGVFERSRIGWAYWDSSPSFGLVTLTGRGRELRGDQLAALGLGAP